MKCLARHGLCDYVTGDNPFWQKEPDMHPLIFITTLLLSLLGGWALLVCYVFAPQWLAYLDLSDLLSALAIGALTLGGGLWPREAV